ncbi:hypothetical protein BDN72DRAFT_904675 [Pluteus cervinus]|uniref:Uncharacterized protein n=1 Tax=Pluteus cervinus TaxID=181527 RepID=A0ACD3A570_9AGAR|nr:hypothetical protein BDN72DRAFT_904675 [Pluteus cervinus]
MPRFRSSYTFGFVYYTDIVCSRNKIHYDPSGAGDMSETGTLTSMQIANALDSKKRCSSSYIKTSGS